MTAKSSSHVLVLLSVAFGLAVAALSVAGSGAVGIFAVIGGIVLGVLWTGRSILMKRPRRTPSGP